MARRAYDAAAGLEYVNADRRVRRTGILVGGSTRKGGRRGVEEREPCAVDLRADCASRCSRRSVCGVAGACFATPVLALWP